MWNRADERETVSCLEPWLKWWKGGLRSRGFNITYSARQLTYLTVLKKEISLQRQTEDKQRPWVPPSEWSSRPGSTRVHLHFPHISATNRYRRRDCELIHKVDWCFWKEDGIILLLSATQAENNDLMFPDFRIIDFLCFLPAAQQHVAVFTMRVLETPAAAETTTETILQVL